MRKSDDNKKSFFRSSDRLFRVDDNWFAETREGDIGPFSSRGDASRALRQHIGEQESLQSARKELEKLREDKKTVDTSIWDQQINND